MDATTLPSKHTTEGITPAYALYLMDHLEHAARQRLFRDSGGYCRYRCSRCGGAYTLSCTNPWCRQPRGERHTLPAELIAGVKREQREKRDRQRDAIREQVRALFAQQVDAVRAYRTAHPDRRYAIVELPSAEEIRSYSWSTRDDPFYQTLPPELAIRWQTVRVNLTDGGSYQPSHAKRIDVPRVTTIPA